MTKSSVNAADWRSGERQRLIRERQAIIASEKLVLDIAIRDGLEALLGSLSPKCVAVYWPLPGEPDLSDWYGSSARAGSAFALPVVVARQQALAFRQWTPGEQMGSDLLNIPCPINTDDIEPDVIVLPCVGFDAEGYRLGNGGGYYDRTLAGLADRPATIGVAYERLKLPSVRPQAHDIPMNFVVSEKRVYCGAAGQAR